jgi:hypothetical protein
LNLSADSRAEITVELDIFSGRPNPTWTLGPAQRTSLLSLLREANERAASPSVIPGLGYRGFVVTVTSPAGSEIVRVGDGSIEAAGQRFVDSNRAVEEFIAASMPRDLKDQFGSMLPMR